MFFTVFENLCKSHGKTTTGVCAEIGVSKSTVAYWRANKSVIPKADVLTKIADYFNVSVDYLLGKTNIQNPAISSSSLSEKEAEIIELFRSVPEDIQQSVFIILKAYDSAITQTVQKLNYELAFIDNSPADEATAKIAALGGDMRDIPYSKNDLIKIKKAEQKEIDLQDKNE